MLFAVPMVHLTRSRPGRASKEIAENDPGLHLRQRGAEAEMNTVAEGDVRIGGTGDVKFFRPFKVF